jgi:hypothetical protein
VNGLTDYEGSQRSIVRRVGGLVTAAVLPWVRVRDPRPLPPGEIERVFRAVFPIIEEHAVMAGDSAREFYDSERERVLGEITPLFRHQVRPEWIAESLAEPLTGFALEPSSVNAAVLGIAGADAVRDEARATARRMVSDDPAALGYARVESGGSSCAFCTILISRGPAYKTAESAGLANVFHANDDCRVVPVFDRNDWAGKADYEQAGRDYIAASKQAKSEGISIDRALRARLENR